MYTIQLNIDDTIFDEFMESLNKLPKEKFEFISEKKSLNASIAENKINELLRTHNLSHFKFLKDPDRVIYTHESGSVRHQDDYKKMISVFKDNHINHSDIGIDVVYIEDENVPNDTNVI